jgi:ribosomal protein S18 acetylase RimI-like enzyme
MLVQSALDALRKEGIRKESLVAFSSNVQAISFWKKLGFSRREDLYYMDIQIVEDSVS